MASENARISTGFYGVPGGYGGKVHLHQSGRPMCNARLKPESQFQWCAHGIVKRFLECEKCKRIADDLLFAEFEQRVSKTRARSWEGKRLRTQLELWRDRREKR